MDNRDQPPKPSLWHIVISILAGALGVQSHKNRERDFSHGSIYTYLIAGAIFTLVFIVGMIFLVRLVISSQ